MPTIFKQVAGIWQQLGGGQRLVLATIACLFVAILVAIGVGATRPDYQLLAGGLTQTETARIAGYLQAQNVPYRLVDNDSAVLVPAADRMRLLNVLAEQELLTDSSNGFELLDSVEMGRSVFLERKTYDRAVAGELERILREIDGVRGARVIVQRGAESPFALDESQASAAVKLSMNSGRRLSKAQLAGVIHLVSGAVGDLGPDRVQVMDDHGLLSVADDGSGAGIASSSLEAEQAVERHLTAKSQDLLDRILGPGRSLVSIAVDLDFTKRTEASSEPISPQIIETKTSETAESTPLAGERGLSGTASNIEGAPPGNAALEPATRSSSEETKLFVTGKRTTTLDDEVGRIRGMSVSILLDHQKQPAAEEGGEAIWQEFAPAERDRFRELVLDAIGYHAALGSQKAVDPKGNAAERFSVTVQSMRMHGAESVEPAAAPVAAFDPAQLETWLRYGAAALVLLGLLLIARGQLKRGQRAWNDEQARRTAKERERNARSDSPDSRAAFDAQRRAQLKEQVQERVTGDPDGAAAIVKGWMHGG